MAKSKSYFSLRRGSTKSQTFSVLRGQQITKDRVTEVANPKTTAQMRQRALFATAVKFYKHANQNFFKFAFEDKKQRESEYNAFMRHNLQHSIIMSYEESKNAMVPALGDGWQLTQGQLSSPALEWDNETLNLMGNFAGTDLNWGKLSAAIIAQYSLQAGDIMTIVVIQSSMDASGTEVTVAPKWNIYQERLDPTSTADVPDWVGDNSASALSMVFGVDESLACGAAVVFSRNIPGSGVKVSTSQLVNNDTAAALVTGYQMDPSIEVNLASWGATGKAILQGGLLGE